ncbi:MAG: PadR family transcriptional regulator, regulatory protein PadR [Actinomycetota bacterium]|jgi:DNA-binding PadR family transcriptional regulator|uniref:PadR family transcriptional regulator n=1 Tax=Amycolatopsis sp. NPDC088138 TaxID=3363938 RepID=UPI0028C79768|nr:PadR family transcriptional regulator, regulatory protein PadR [Actinomycetota bacterium]
MAVRMTLQTRLVLHALLQVPESELYGLDLIRATGLGPGTVYPILQRLERAGWLTSRWERVDPSDEARPARRYYALTGEGVRDGLRELAAAESRSGSLTNLLGSLPKEARGQA